MLWLEFYVLVQPRVKPDPSAFYSWLQPGALWTSTTEPQIPGVSVCMCVCAPFAGLKLYSIGESTSGGKRFFCCSSALWPTTTLARLLTRGNVGFPLANTHPYTQPHCWSNWHVLNGLEIRTYVMADGFCPWKGLPKWRVEIWKQETAKGSWIRNFRLGPKMVNKFGTKSTLKIVAKLLFFVFPKGMTSCELKGLLCKLNFFFTFFKFQKNPLHNQSSSMQSVFTAKSNKRKFN